LLQVKVIRALGAKQARRALPLLKRKFPLDGVAVGHAWQKSWGATLALLGLGLGSKELFEKSLEPFQQQDALKELVEGGEEFYKNFQSSLWEPFVEGRFWSPTEQELFRRKMSRLCLQLARQRDELFPLSLFPQISLPRLLKEEQPENINGELLRQVEERGPHLDEAQEAFLCHQDLLQRTLLFFFCESFAGAPWLQESREQLQEGGLWVELSEPGRALETLRGVFQRQQEQAKEQIEQGARERDQAEEEKDHELADMVQVLVLRVGRELRQQRDIEHRLDEIVVQARAVWEETILPLEELAQQIQPWGREVPQKFDALLSVIDVEREG